MLVNKCRIYDEDNRARSTHYKSLYEGKGKNQYHGKPYSAPTHKGKQRILDEKRPSGWETPASIMWFKCGELGHRANECQNNVLRCFKYGKKCHHIVDCKSIGTTCYNYGEQGHIGTNCQKPKKIQSGGKVFLWLGQRLLAQTDWFKVHVLLIVFLWLLLLKWVLRILLFRLIVL